MSLLDEALHHLLTDPGHDVYYGGRLLKGISVHPGAYAWFWEHEIGYMKLIEPQDWPIIEAL